MKYRIIVVTLVTAGKLASAGFPKDHFTHLFIDEAGHATEPEAMVALSGVLAKQGGIMPQCEKMKNFLSSKIFLSNQLFSNFFSLVKT